MKILFVDMHREGRSPSQRFRYEQYLDFLKENGIDWEHSYLLSAADDNIFYQSGNYFKKLFIFVRSLVKRLKDVRRTRKYIDFVFIQREAFMLGTTYFERQFAKCKAKVIFDFDDSIWMSQESKSSAPNKNLSWLKRPEKTMDIIKLSDMIIAGNSYLADYARQFNKNVIIIPTTIDTNLYKPKINHESKGSVCIGWSGSKTTIDHFEEAVPALIEIKNRYGGKVYFKVIGDNSYRNEALDIKGISWNKETEVEDLLEIDIGIMPLPDDAWSKGKCGLKGLQYMSLKIPTLMSPVGVNCEIIEDGVNGFLPKNKTEWVEKLSLLIENDEIRSRTGCAGRETVQDKYSVISQKDRFLQCFF